MCKRNKRILLSKWQNFVRKHFLSTIYAHNAYIKWFRKVSFFAWLTICRWKESHLFFFLFYFFRFLSFVVEISHMCHIEFILNTKIKKKNTFHPEYWKNIEVWKYTITFLKQSLCPFEMFTNELDNKNTKLSCKHYQQCFNLNLESL